MSIFVITLVWAGAGGARDVTTRGLTRRTLRPKRTELVNATVKKEFYHHAYATNDTVRLSGGILD